MSICYEFALECRLKRDVSPEVIDTLNYMTRSEDYSFSSPKINDPLFRATSWKWSHEINGRKIAATRKVTVIKHEWRTIINNCPREGEQYLPGEFGSLFQNNRLSFRHLSRDDILFNVWWLLLPWLASLSETTGFVGYYREDFDDYPTLVHFGDGKASVHELIPTKSLQTEVVASSDDQEPGLLLAHETMTEIVKQGLLRQAENPKMSLEAYISSVVARRDIMDAALELGQLPNSQSFGCN